MLELLPLLSVAASAGPVTVVTFDNGEFDAPLYTPRWNGKWKQPSAAQEMASSIARVIGENPEVHTYLPPGQGRASPGGHSRILPAKAGCAGPAAAPGDVCWCGPADNCWSDLQPNWYPDASTSLYLTAQDLRRTAAPGPRLEIHVTDLFEEDPSAAENPRDSDRCVTADGVRRAIAALLTPPDGVSLDHLAIGLLRARIDPPPPGGSWGNVYTLEPAGEGCFSGKKAGPWVAGREPLGLTMAVIVVGLGTAGAHDTVSGFLDGLVGQLDAGAFEFQLVRVVEPPAARTASRVLSASDTDPLVLQPIGPLPTVPCGVVAGEASLRSQGLPVPVTSVVGRCDGSVELSFADGALPRVFLAQAGLSPRSSSLDLSGTVTLRGDRSTLDERLVALRELDESARPLPFVSVLEEQAAALAGSTPWTSVVTVASVRVDGVDGRPWGLAGLSGTVLGLAFGLGAAALTLRLHAARALRRHWAVSMAGGRDPLLQRPIAAVLGAAQEEVARSWPLRVLVGVGVGLAVAFLSATALLLGYRVLLG